MEYKSNYIKSYLTYYIISDSIRFYDQPLAAKFLYTQSDPIVALGEDIVRKFKFCIMMKGSDSIIHPCSYISIPNKMIMEDWYDKENTNPELGLYVDVHGGVTFYGRESQINENIFGSDDSWIGWDYAHSGDYIYDYNKALGSNININLNNHKWTTEELLNDVFQVYEDLIDRRYI